MDLCDAALVALEDWRFTSAPSTVPCQLQQSLDSCAEVVRSRHTSSVGSKVGRFDIFNADAILSRGSLVGFTGGATALIFNFYRATIHLNSVFRANKSSYDSMSPTRSNVQDQSRDSQSQQGSAGMCLPHRGAMPAPIFKRALSPSVKRGLRTHEPTQIRGMANIL